MHDQGLAGRDRLAAAVGHGGLDEIILRARQLLVVVARGGLGSPLVVQLALAVLYE